VPRGGLILQISEYAEAPAWTSQSHVLLCRIEVEVDRSDTEEVFEIGRGFRKVVSKRGSLAVEDEPQLQPCPGGDTEVVQDDGMCRPCGNSECT
jgi:hypothetical protein